MTNCANSMYGQDTIAKSLQRHVYPPIFVKILKVETMTAVDDDSIKMSTSHHMCAAQPQRMLLSFILRLQQLFRLVSETSFFQLYCTYLIDMRKYIQLTENILNCTYYTFA